MKALEHAAMTQAEIEPTSTTALVKDVPYPADRNPALVYLASLSPGSRRTMAHSLRAIAELVSGGRATLETLNWGVLRFQHTSAIRAALLERYSPATTNKMLSALRGVLKRAWRLGYMSADEYQAAVDLDPVGSTRRDQAAGRALTPGELLALLNVCENDDTAAGPRDAAIIGLLYACGLRRAEVAGLNVEDYDPATSTLTVRGKRHKTRTVPVTNGAQAALLDWLYLRGTKPGPMFVRIPKSGYLAEERLTDQGIYYILQRRAEEAGVEHFTPHDLRRTYAGDLLDAGADLATVQKLMGHSNPQTTASYDRRGERAKREAAERLHVPYRRRFEDLED